MKSESHSVMYNSLQSRGLYNPWNSPGQNTGVGSLSLLQGIFPTQGLNPGLSTLQADSLPAEPQGKSKNTGVGSLSLLQRIFLTQELNRGLLHYRQIPYQLSYQGSFCVYTNIFTHILWKQRKYFLLNCSWNYHKNWTQAENKISRKQKQDRKLSMITMKESQKLKIKSKHTKSLHPEGKKKHLSSLWVKESGQTEIHNIWEKSNEMVRG